MNLLRWEKKTKSSKTTSSQQSSECKH